MARQGPNPQLPISLRTAFRPILAGRPNAPLLLEAMLLTNGFVNARGLVVGLTQGLHALHAQGDDSTGGGPLTRDASSTMSVSAAATPSRQAGPVTATEGQSRNSGYSHALFSASSFFHVVALPTVRMAAALLPLETARELKFARRKLGLASLTMSERKAKTEELSKAVAARVLIASFVKALLKAETAGSEVSLDTNIIPGHPATPTVPSSKLATGRGTMREAGFAITGASVSAKGNGAAKSTQAISLRREMMVSTFEETDNLQEILQPLVDLEVQVSVITCVGELPCIIHLLFMGEMASFHHSS